jgi:hypothetical protein
VVIFGDLGALDHHKIDYSCRAVPQRSFAEALEKKHDASFARNPILWYQPRCSSTRGIMQPRSKRNFHSIAPEGTLGAVGSQTAGFFPSFARATCCYGNGLA